jgi:hypothetical protein
MISTKIVLATLATLGAFALSARTASAEPSAHIDHIILGVADLDQGVARFEQLTGVRPIYGGKHPTGTHNALVSLGGDTYLEIIAVQPGATPPAHFAALSGLKELTPIGWAVSASDLEFLRGRLSSAGMALTPPTEGSRVTPAGATLHWQTFGLQDEVDEAPFFIVWSAGTAHPSSTSPKGCTLGRWSVAGPHGKILEQLRSTLGLPVETSTAPAPAMRLELECPKGTVVFEPAARPK